MEHTTPSAVFSIAAPFRVLKASRPSTILLAPLHGIKAVSSFLAFVSQQRAGSAKKRNLLPDAFSLGNLIKQFFDVARAQALPHSAGSVPATSREAEPNSGEEISPAAVAAVRPLFAGGHQALLERIDLLERRLRAAGVAVPIETDWIPPVKGGSLSSNRSGATEPRASEGVAEATLERTIFNETTGRLRGGFNLANRKVLCVGGRAALYPEYCRLVQAFGGNLFFHRSDPHLGGEKLSESLAQADMVVCPLDCVNHHAFFSVKRYCKYSGTPCVLLDRSDIHTFRKGIAILTGWSCSRSGERKQHSFDKPSFIPINPVWKRRVAIR